MSNEATLILRLDQELKDEFQDHCENTSRTMSAVVKKLLELYLEDEEFRKMLYKE